MEIKTAENKIKELEEELRFNDSLLRKFFTDYSRLRPEILREPITKRFRLKEYRALKAKGHETIMDVVNSYTEETIEKEFEEDIAAEIQDVLLLEYGLLLKREPEK